MNTRHSKSTRRTVITIIVAGQLLAAAAHAADTIDPEAMQTVAAVATTGALGATAKVSATQPTCKPTMSTKLASKNRQKISGAFDVALNRVREVDSCRDLFADLGSNGMDTLSTLVFIPIGRAEARGEACRGVSAYTLHGGGPVWVCREFSRLSDAQAAMVIIHEALHHAGLSEYPKDPDAMTSRAINGMVSEKCGL
jgi:hypothetical protein